MIQAKLIQDAIDAIDKVYNHRGVSIETTIDSLRELVTFTEAKIGNLKNMLSDMSTQDEEP